MLVNLIDSFRVSCPICGKVMPTLKRHLMIEHKMSYLALEAYRRDHSEICFVAVDVVVLANRKYKL